jgi:hypothetical protein
MTKALKNFSLIEDSKDKVELGLMRAMIGLKSNKMESLHLKQDKSNQQLK